MNEVYVTYLRFLRWGWLFPFWEGEAYACVDFDAEDGHENGERSVGEYADEGVVADGHQGGQHRPENHARVDRVLPLVRALKAHYELKQTIVGQVQCGYFW